jgi:hypothetical protein
MNKISSTTFPEVVPDGNFNYGHQLKEILPISSSPTNNPDISFQSSNNNKSSSSPKQATVNGVNYFKRGTFITEEVPPFEKCTIQTSLNLGIFAGESSPSTFFDPNIIPPNEQDKIKVKKADFKDPKRQYSVCNVSGFENCAIISPWLSESQTDQTKCSLSLDKCPPRFQYDQKEGNICKKESVVNHLLKKPTSSYCSERWYDWFSVPNYHYGNSYFKDNANLESEKDICKCYEPCSLGFIPYVANTQSPPTAQTDENNTCMSNRKCILKTDTAIYEEFPSDYTPVAAIVLLGSLLDDSLFTSEYNRNLEKAKKDAIQKSKIPQEENPAIIKDFKTKYEKFILEDKKDINTRACTAIKHEPFNISSVYILSTNSSVYKSMIGTIEKDQLLFAYNIAKTLENETKDIIKKRISETYYIGKSNIHDIADKSMDIFIEKHFNILYKSCIICFKEESPFKQSLLTLLNQGNWHEPDIVYETIEGLDKAILQKGAFEQHKLLKCDKGIVPKNAPESSIFNRRNNSSSATPQPNNEKRFRSVASDFNANSYIQTIQALAIFFIVLMCIILILSIAKSETAMWIYKTIKESIFNIYDYTLPTTGLFPKIQSSRIPLEKMKNDAKNLLKTI